MDEENSFSKEAAASFAWRQSISGFWYTISNALKVSPDGKGQRSVLGAALVLNSLEFIHIWLQKHTEKILRPCLCPRIGKILGSQHLESEQFGSSAWLT